MNQQYIDGQEKFYRITDDDEYLRTVFVSPNYAEEHKEDTYIRSNYDANA